ncbi:BCCT family transporter, partial [Bacillus cereus]
LVALCIAYFTFRKGRASTISATVGPLFKGGEHGRIAHTFDVLAVFATVFGVATSLGLGAKQIAGGVSYLTSIPNSLPTQLVIIGIVTVLYMLSAQ